MSSASTDRLVRLLPGGLRRRLDALVEQRVQQELRSRKRRDRDLRFVMVVAPGRSGSTLLQGLLNTIPGTLVRGENNFYLHGYYGLMRDFLAFRHQHRKGRPRQPVSAFFGVRDIRRTHFVEAARSLFLSGAVGDVPRDEIRVIGFKEVLWDRISVAERAEFFEFLDDVFPGAHYVLNTRDPEVVVGSGFWASQDRDEALEAVSRVHETQQFLRDTRPDRTFDVRYETITGDDGAARVAQLRGLVEFVTGAPAGIEVVEAMVGAMGEHYGPHAFGRSRRDGRGATKPRSSAD